MKLFKNVFTDTAPTTKHAVLEIPHFVTYVTAMILKYSDNWSIASGHSELRWHRNGLIHLSKFQYSYFPTE